MTQRASAITAPDLDALHAAAHRAYYERNVTAYMAIFASDLRYKQPNGCIIGREQLARNVAAQFASVEAATTTYARESLQVDGDRAVEMLRQSGSVTTRHFLFFRRSWHLVRRGRYTWARTSSGLQIVEVDVLDEVITRGAA